jgi:hypothetical protein
MLNLNIPQRTYFTFSFSCPYRPEPPQIDGSIRDWDDMYKIPDLMGLEGREPYASLYMAWNDTGLYFALQIKGKTRYKVDPKNYWQGDCLELWIDTRDMKDTHRANRYCHHFYFLPGGSGRDGREAIGRQTTIERAREQAPPCPEDAIRLAAKRLKRSCQMEIALPANGLNGFHPREFGRLGFNYILHDVELGVQSWSVGREPPSVHDPSTWGVVELCAEQR